jgi:hypothetical protein
MDDEQLAAAAARLATDLLLQGDRTSYGFAAVVLRHETPPGAPERPVSYWSVVGLFADPGEAVRFFDRFGRPRDVLARRNGFGAWHAEIHE